MKNRTRTSKNLGHAIREHRKSKSLTQKDLAVLSGIWQETVSKVENGLPGTKMETIFDLLSALELELIVAPRNKDVVKIEDIF